MWLPLATISGKIRLVESASFEKSYNLSRASYQKNWGTNYQRPLLAKDFLAFVIRIIPKFEPLKVLQLKTPTAETERMFEASFNTTLDRYRQLLSQVGTDRLHVPNDNCDTGEITGPGKYRLNDETHAKLLAALAKQDFRGASPEVQAELLEFFGHPDAPYAIKRKPKDWAKVQAELEQLKMQLRPQSRRPPLPIMPVDGVNAMAWKTS